MRKFFASNETAMVRVNRDERSGSTFIKDLIARFRVWVLNEFGFPIIVVFRR